MFADNLKVTIEKRLCVLITQGDAIYTYGMRSKHTTFDLIVRRKPPMEYVRPYS